MGYRGGFFEGWVEFGKNENDISQYKSTFCICQDILTLRFPSPSKHGPVSRLHMAVMRKAVRWCRMNTVLPQHTLCRKPLVDQLVKSVRMLYHVIMFACRCACPTNTWFGSSHYRTWNCHTNLCERKFMSHCGHSIIKFPVQLCSR